jgi:hypothetical protein
MVPEYEYLKNMLENGPEITAVLRTINLSTRVRIEEDWSVSDGSSYYTATYSNLDSRCDWAAEQLHSWKSVTRLSHQEWKFLRRKDAEKFITLFNLKWASQ